MTTNANNQPIFKIKRPGGISTAVFINEKRDGGTFHSITVQRSFKVGDDWKRSSLSLGRDQIPLVIQALQQTYDYLLENPLVANGPDSETSEVAEDAEVEATETVDA